MTPHDVEQRLRQLPGEAWSLYGLPLATVTPLIEQGTREQWSGRQWAEASARAIAQLNQHGGESLPREDEHTRRDDENVDGASGRPTQTRDEKPTGNTVKPRKPNPKETTPMIPKPSQNAQRTPSAPRAPGLAVANPPQTPKPANSSRNVHTQPPAAEALSLLTVGDVAKLLKLSQRQVWKLAKAGRLPAPLRLGRSVRWRAADLARFLEAGGDLAKYNGGA